MYFFVYLIYLCYLIYDLCLKAILAVSSNHHNLHKLLRSTFSDLRSYHICANFHIVSTVCSLFSLHIVYIPKRKHVDFDLYNYF